MTEIAKKILDGVGINGETWVVLNHTTRECVL